MVEMTIIASLSLALNAWLTWLLVRQSGAVTVRPSFRRVSRETPPKPAFRVPQPPTPVVEDDEPEPAPPVYDRAATRAKVEKMFPGKTVADYDAAMAEIEAHGGRMLSTLR